MTRLTTVSGTSAAHVPFDVQKVRRDFPILQQRLPGDVPLVYLDSGASAQKPRQVIDRIRECYETEYSNVHRGVHTLGDRVTTAMEEARETVRRYLNAASSEEIIFTSGTTAAINTVAYGWGRKFLKPGDEILLSIQEHHANFVPWQQVAQWTGAKLRLIPLTDSGELDLDAFDKLLSERSKLLAVTAMSNVLGTINPLDRLAESIHSVGGRILVDGAQSIPHGPTDLQRSKIDFFAFSGHKVYGPSGIGVLYGRRELLERMDPMLFGGNMIREVFDDHSTWADLPAKFEAGTAPIAPAIALGTALDYVSQFDPVALHAHERAVTASAMEKLSEIPGLKILGPELSKRGPIVSFTVEGVHPHDLGELINRKGVAIRVGHHCTMPLHRHLDISSSARASFGLYNTPEEVDALVDAIHYARQVFRLA